MNQGKLDESNRACKERRGQEGTMEERTRRGRTNETRHRLQPFSVRLHDEVSKVVSPGHRSIHPPGQVLRFVRPLYSHTARSHRHASMSMCTITRHLSYARR